MKIKIALHLLLFSSLIQAQELTGLWMVEEVRVGEETMTPVAKWFKYDDDGTYTGGNGWLQNDEGIWRFDLEAQTLETKNSYGLEDPFGPFKVSAKDNKMIWERKEEGMNVIVTLSRTDKLPKSPADWLVGIWGLQAAEKNGADNLESLDAERKIYFFIRWDRVVIQRNDKGERKTGYWHIHGHRPEVTFLPHDSQLPAETWRVEPGPKALVMTGISDTNRDQVLKFGRLRDFPE
ncbi:MAG: hypothetical protein R8G66_31020 [Cytophagales bacterium]|nr:hypothetical protein [Cytophagales bacterium]